jgi:hypothetical protein
VPAVPRDSPTASLRRDSAPPRAAHGVPAWDRAAGSWRLRFLGRGADWTPAAGLGALAPAAALAWVEQRHTTAIAPARAGACGVADALAVEEAGLAALVVTADCVPVAVMRGARALLVHAGWRGVAGELPLQAAERLAADCGETEEMTAWIGPAIGPCCYEVGEEVAAAVAAVSGATCVRRVGGERPRLDLRLAVAAQLASAGVARIDLLDHCTRCRPEWLWSYRREGAGAGRNLTLLWRES